MTKAMRTEINHFVATLLLDGGVIREPMCWKEANENIAEWKREGIELPKGLTPYYLATTWNDLIGGEC